MAGYERAIAKLVEHLVQERSVDVRFVSTCQGIPEYWTNDARTAKRIVGRLAPALRTRVHIDESFHDPEQLIDLLAGFDLVVATRMHMAILALIAGTPVLPIAYEFKTEELFQRLGAGAWVTPIEQVRDTVLIERYDSYVAVLDQAREPLFAEVQKERLRALAAVDLLRSLPL
jgi:colanic acid/amylovoran biosynthesis protein